MAQRFLMAFVFLPLLLCGQEDYAAQIEAINQLLERKQFAVATAQASALVQIGKESRLPEIQAEGNYLLGRALLETPDATTDQRITGINAFQSAAVVFRRLKDATRVSAIAAALRKMAVDEDLIPVELPRSRRAKDSLEESALGAIVALQNREIEALTDSQVRQLILLERQDRQLDRYELEALNDSLQLTQQRAEIDKQEAVIEAERLQRNISFVGGLSILLLTALLYSRYLSGKRYQARISAAKERSDELLLNILPASVADELMKRGRATARRYEQVSVLFVDFKGFSALAKGMEPETLVGMLDEAFRAFDGIVAAFGLEKIKTIGDSYMCAAGVPEPLADHAVVATRAALEMQLYLQGNPNFSARIGIHSGPVVAGVVGRDKFAYDIWGDTVNQAARLEAAGEVGEVSISKTTCELLGDAFRCEHAGTFEAKNIGTLDRFHVISEGGD